MKIENEFTVHAPIEEAWKVLTDLEGIAPCLPGAQLTGVDGDVYRGKVKIKVGPVISEFAGTARFAEKDDDAHRAVIDAKGRDSRSAGNAAAMITATLRSAGESTVVNVDTDMKISGKLAQFGSGMIKEVSQKLLGQFVTSLEAKIAGGQSGDGDTTPAGSDVNLAPSPPEPGQAEPDPQQAKTTVSETAEDLREARLEARGDAPPESVEAASEGVTDTPILHPGGTGALSAVADDSRVPGPGQPAPVANGATTHVAGSQNATPKISPAASRPRAAVVADEPEPLDLMKLAGGSIRKRVIPVAVGAVVVVAAVLIWRQLAR
jgi:carbon monoxide dehydrogenase subunit G